MWQDFFMVIKDAWTGTQNTAISLGNAALPKAVLAFLPALWSINMLYIVLGFVILIFVDLATKLIERAHVYLTDIGDTENASEIWACFMNLKKAAEKGYISSYMMKTRFCGKILLYAIVLMLACGLDLIFSAGNIFKTTFVAYLALSEALSAFENLRNIKGGIIDYFVTFIKSRFGRVGNG